MIIGIPTPSLPASAPIPHPSPSNLPFVKQFNYLYLEFNDNRSVHSLQAPILEPKIRQL
jgi:hypothetical protein